MQRGRGWCTLHVTIMVALAALQQTSDSPAFGTPWNPIVVESGWCIPFISSVDTCLHAAIDESLRAAHVAAHAAGMLKPNTVKARARETAIRSAEAADSGYAALEQIKRFEAFKQSMGELGIIVAMAASAGRVSRGSEPAVPAIQSHARVNALRQSRCHPRNYVADFL